MSDYQDYYENHGYPVPEGNPVDQSYNTPDTEFGNEENSE